MDAPADIPPSMTRRLLVTGASGFVGKAVMPAARKAGWSVRAMSRKPHAPTPGSAFLSMHSKSSFDIFPAENAPTDSNTEMICRSCPL